MRDRRAALASAVPVLTVVLVVLLLMYPLALLFGLPLARQRMDNLANWVRATASLIPLAEAPADAAEAGVRERLRFFGGAESLAAEDGTVPLGPREAVLVQDGVPLPIDFTLAGDDVVFDARALAPLLTWTAPLEGPLPDTGGRVFRLPRSAAPGEAAGTSLSQPALYAGGRLLRQGAVPSVERADGVRVTFSFAADSGPVAVAGRLLSPEEFTASGVEVTLGRAPPFNAEVVRVTGDYVVLDLAAGLVALVEPSAEPPLAAASVISLAERLIGPVDGVNRRFTLQHAPLIESDPGRRVFVDGVELSVAAERPAERVDGVRRAFSFASPEGVVTVAGVEMTPGVDFDRDGGVVTFRTPPARNAALRQYPDYLVSDLQSGAVTLATAPEPGSVVWAAAYSYYDRPACGETVIACFLSLPQHPVPFPHWIAAGIGPFFTAYPLGDPRNIFSAVLYTALGTLTALALGALAGLLLAALFVWVRPFERALLPWVIASQTIPVIALVPVLVMLLGNAGVTVQTSFLPTAIIGAYIAFFPVTVGTVTGLRSVDPLALDLMKGYAASPWEVFVKVRFPAAVPFFFTSLKLGAAAALVGALVAEVESNNRRGLGYAIIGQVQAGDVADVWILLIISALLGIALVALVGLLQRLLAPWQRQEASS